MEVNKIIESWFTSITNNTHLRKSDFEVDIKDSLSGQSLTSCSVPASEIPLANTEWVDFDFLDIQVTVDTTYYIVCKTNTVSNNHFVCLLCIVLMHSQTKCTAGVFHFCPTSFLLMPLFLYRKHILRWFSNIFI